MRYFESPCRPIPPADPNNSDAEAAILGAILADNSVFGRIDLSASDFYVGFHADLFDAIAALIGDGRRVDLVTLAPVIRGKKVHGVDVESYVQGLPEHAPPSPEALTDYVREVRSLSGRRKVLRQIKAIAERGSRLDTSDSQIAADIDQLRCLTIDADVAEPVEPVRWPALDPRAMHGVAGELARLATANTEADPVAVLATALAWAGALFGRGRYLRVGDDLHHPRLFACLVGASSRARKGTSTAPVRAVMDHVGKLLPLEPPLRVESGLSTGEGLIAAIRDGTDDDDDAGGTDDKRLMVIESELGRVLRAATRQGSTISAIMRCAWDGVRLGILTKVSAMTATDPHVAVLGHITRTELTELLADDDVHNGYVNRFLWFGVRRRATIPFPVGVSDADAHRIAGAIAEAVRYARERADIAPAISFDGEARELWVARYPEITRDQPGTLGVVTARAEAQIIRLALTYAMLAGADTISCEHLEAAMALHQYAVESARFVFCVKGEVPRDPIAERVLNALAAGPKSQSQLLREVFNRNVKTSELAIALQGLQERGLIVSHKEKKTGRPSLIWSLTTKTT